MSPNAGLYGAPARDARERDALVNSATKDLTKGVAGKVAEASSSFGYKLIKQLPAEGNVIISPLSISSALAMTLNGAAGDTQRQMLDALGYVKLTPLQVNEASRTMRDLLGNVDPTVQLQVANSIWTRKGVEFKPEFLKTNEDSFGAKTSQLDFGSDTAVATLNSWVKDATQGKIEKIIERLTDDDRMVLMNAVYFKGTWKSPFAKEATTEGKFTNAKGAAVTVPMMAQQGSFPYADSKDYQAVSLPYGNGRIEMTIYLPKGSIDDMVKASVDWPKDTAPKQNSTVAVKMPKFKAEYEQNLNKSLQALGMKEAFTDKADFSGMTGDKTLFVSEVMHKTFIEVDEAGTEAAAATSVKMTLTTTARDQAVQFTVDKPFLFVIRESATGLVLFTGVIRDPGAK